MASAGSSSLATLPGTSPATLGDWQYQIGGVVLGKGTSYLVTGFDGLGTPDVRSNDVAKTLDDGDWMGRDTYGSRVLTLTIVVRGVSAADVEANYQALQQAWYSDPKTPYYNLWWRLGGMAPQRAIGKPRRMQANKSALLRGRIDVTAEFYSPFAALFAEDITLVATPRIMTGGGRVYPETYPKNFAVTTSGAGSIFPSNTGSYPAWPTLTFGGGAINTPRLNNLTDGTSIGFNVQMMPGDTLVVDLRLRTARLNGQNVRPYLSDGSTWFPIAPASAPELAFAAFAADATAYCAVEYTPATLG